jgi:hypothetical protein
MKKTKIIILFAMLMSIVRLNAVTYTYNGIRYDLNESKCTASVISNSYSGDVVIPSTIMKSSTSYTVNSIGRDAFKNCSNLNSVTIGNNVTMIEDFAFQGCNLSSIVIPNSVTKVGYNAFRGCTSLTTISFGNSLATIDEGAFLGCKELTSVSLPNSLNTIGKWAFYGCNNLTNVNIPRNVISIGGGAFSRCLSITVDSNNKKYDSRNSCNAVVETASNTLIAGCQNTVITNDVTSIGNYAFDGCIGLSSMIIPSNVNSIGISAFEGCNGLTSFTIPGTVNTIGMWAFQDCKNLSSVIIENGVTSIGQYAFYGCSNLIDVTIDIATPLYLATETFSNSANATLYVPAGSKVSYEAADNWKDFKEIVEMVAPSPAITFVDANVKALCVANWDTNGDGELSEEEAAVVTDLGEVFKGNEEITSFDELQYFSGLTTIPAYSFYCCKGIKSVTIPNSVKSIGLYAFAECHNVTSIIIPNSVTSIEDGAFKTCINLKNLIIPNSVTSIGESVFTFCNGFTSIIIPNSVKSIGLYAFNQCINLTSINIPSSVTTISEGLFKGCIKLSDVTIHNSITSIGAYAFSSCDLTDLNIPKSVNSIGFHAFENCNSLTSVTVEWETPLSVNNSIITNYTDVILHVPAGCKAAYEAADYWKDFKEIKVITENITIGAAGMGTYCSTHALDFSGTDDIKAYIVSAFKPSTGEVTLTRITDVPANTGIVVKGDANTYAIPWGPGETIVSNMLVGVTENTVLNKEEDDYTNYILAKKNGNLGFYAVTDGSTLSAGKAYLPLPTASLPSGARDFKLIFGDDETTGIKEALSNSDSHGDIYDLQGRRIENPTHGLYIVNGKKVIIK